MKIRNRFASVATAILLAPFFTACGGAAPAVPSLGTLDGAQSSAPAPQRMDTVIGVITGADLPLIQLRPVQVAAKYTKMASSHISFVRGSLALFEHDLDADASVWSILPDEQAWLPNDPHPENIGTMGDERGIVVDWNDFDGSHVGSTGHDVLRGAVSLSVFVRQIHGGVSADAVRAFAEGYQAADPGPGGRYLAALLDDAMTKGASRDELGDVVQGPNGPALKRSASRVDVTPEVFAAVVASLPDYLYTRDSWAPDLGEVRDIVQRVGKGVASLPLLRYEVLLAGAAADGSEDVLLQVKETFDWHQIDGQVVGSTIDGAWSVVEGRRIDGAYQDLDLNLGVAQVGDESYVVTTISGWQQGVDSKVLKAALAAGTYDSTDVIALGRYLGGDLALAHLQGGAYSTDLDVDGLVTIAETWADRTDSDAAGFAARLATDGPTFGVQ
jgi:uncharacterized protein (DUF2252 family)